MKVLEKLGFCSDPVPRLLKYFILKSKYRILLRISLTPLGGEVFFPEMTGMLMNAMQPQTKQVGADDTCGPRVCI